MTRVAVDLLFYTGTKGGMEAYVRSLYSCMRAAGPEFEFVGIASTELAAAGAPWFPGELVCSGVSGENRVAWAAGELAVIPRLARRSGAAVLHCPANLGPWRSAVPVVATLHDMLPFHSPQFVPGPHASILRALMRGVARNASRVITISEASKRDILDRLPRLAKRIDVVPLAGSTAPDASERTAAPSGLIALGNRLPHKNVEGVVRALASLSPADRPTLTVTGSRAGDPLLGLRRELELEPWVTLVGWVSESELEDMYSSAAATVVPSFAEGFGLPVLDAMARGCPVLCSDIPALREVGGNVAAYFDPHSVSSIARVIRETLADPAQLAERSRRGVEQAGRFSWDRAAGQTLDSFRTAVSGAETP